MRVTAENEGYLGVGEATSERDHGFHFTQAIEVDTPPNRELLGSKGAGLVEMKRMGLTVPPGFILTTEACQAYYEAGDDLPEQIWYEVLDRTVLLEEETGLKFGDPQRPLVVSGRGGARGSMPGILTSVLNIGLNRNTIQGLAKLEGEWCAWDSLLRAHQSYGVGVRNMRPDDFNGLISRLLDKYGAATHQELPVEALKEAVAECEQIVALPQNPYDHLREAIEAVFKSWKKPEAIAYRREHNIPHDWGTAVNIVQMIFGNKPQDGFAGSGILFTRHPDTGENRPYVAYIAGAQGTDIVGPESIHRLIPLNDLPPAVSEPLRNDYQILAQNYPRPQESEWTHNGKKVYWLQTRDACLSRRAELEIRFEPWREQVRRGVMSRNEAAGRFLEAPDLHSLGPSETLDPRKVSLAQEEGRVLQGISISPGIGIGVAVNSLELAERYNALPEPVSVILLLESPAELNLATLPPNVKGGVTRLGGAASHEAQKFRGRGFPLVFGMADFDRLSSGTEINLDATNGRVIIGPPIPVIKRHVHLPVEVREYLELLEAQAETNPWLQLTHVTEDEQYRYEVLIEQTAATFERLQANLQSPKAWTVGLIEAMIPPEERLPTMILPQENVKVIRAALHQRLDKEHDVSLRTCHAPEAKMGIAPWQAFNNPGEIDNFFDRGGYSSWQKDQALSEVVICCFPKGKLDPEQAWQHCVFSISATIGGVIVQINPHTPQTRDWDAVDPKGIITLRAPVDPGKHSNLGQIVAQLGETVKDDLLSQQFAELVRKTVFERWWTPPFALPNLMAALTQVADINTLEGQARIYRDGRSWIKIYGAKGTKA